MCASIYTSPKLLRSCNTSLKAEGLLLCCHKLMLAVVSIDTFEWIPSTNPYHLVIICLAEVTDFFADLFEDTERPQHGGISV